MKKLTERQVNFYRRWRNDELAVMKKGDVTAKEDLIREEMRSNPSLLAAWTGKDANRREEF